jgi:hypothetical protein
VLTFYKKNINFIKERRTEPVSAPFRDYYFIDESTASRHELNSCNEAAIH